MKNFLMVFAAVTFLAACDRNQTNRDSVASDAYQTLNGKMMAQHALLIEREDALQAQKAQALRNDQPVRRTTRTSRTGSQTTYTSAASERSDAGLIQAPAKKKGWSKAAKGAVIGGVTGAATGAIISKNKAKGAIIGGIIGAGGGYVIGRSQDKKDGRY